jgi:hypothetical protein
LSSESSWTARTVGSITLTLESLVSAWWITRWWTGWLELHRLPEPRASMFLLLLLNYDIFLLVKCQPFLISKQGDS